jgi:N-acetylneuraminic acid mutarotase
MKKSLLFIASVAYISTSFAQRDMQPTNSFAVCTARSNAAAFTLGGKGYYGTGVDSLGNYKNDIWEYDTASNCWTQKASLPLSINNKIEDGGRADAVAFAIDGKGYIGTGTMEDGTVLQDFWCYDAATNTWSNKANFAGGPRTASIGVAVSGAGFIGMGSGGINNPVEYNDLCKYDPTTDSWSAKTALPAAGRSYAAAFVIGKTKSFYIATGASGNSVLSECWKYNATADSWVAQANFPGAGRRGAVAFSANNEGFVGFGFNTNNGYNVLGDLYQFNPATASWSKRSNLKTDVDTARITAASFSFANAGYVLGGIGYGKNFIGVTATCSAYYPTSNIWKTKTYTDISIHKSDRKNAMINNYFAANAEAGEGKKLVADNWKYVQSNGRWIRVSAETLQNMDAAQVTEESSRHSVSSK